VSLPGAPSCHTTYIAYRCRGCGGVNFGNGVQHAPLFPASNWIFFLHNLSESRAQYFACSSRCFVANLLSSMISARGCWCRLRLEIRSMDKENKLCHYKVNTFYAKVLLTLSTMARKVFKKTSA
jgi:hypothetical protein